MSWMAYNDPMNAAPLAGVPKPQQNQVMRSPRAMPKAPLPGVPAPVTSQGGGPGQPEPNNPSQETLSNSNAPQGMSAFAAGYAASPMSGVPGMDQDKQAVEMAKQAKEVRRQELLGR
jgi:hypothetical protein